MVCVITTYLNTQTHIKSAGKFLCFCLAILSTVYSFRPSLEYSPYIIHSATRIAASPSDSSACCFFILHSVAGYISSPPWNGKPIIWLKFQQLFGFGSSTWFTHYLNWKTKNIISDLFHCCCCCWMSEMCVVVTDAESFTYHMQNEIDRIEIEVKRDSWLRSR